MSETLTQTPNIHVNKKTKVAAGVTAIALGLGIGVTMKRGVSAENAFKTDIAIPAENKPHIDYAVKPGDTEGAIAARFGHANDLNYENMINAQLPKADQHDRLLQPGEQLNLPPK
jgi:LysM repeat protein